MSPNRSRFVTACQQVLALGVVLAALTPAASIVTLDVVGSAQPGAGSGTTRTSALAAYTAEAQQKSRVPTAPVKSHVREIQLTAPDRGAGRGARDALRRASRLSAAARRTLTSTPQPVTGFGEVGVTWAHGVADPRDGAHVRARTPHRRSAGPAWSDVPYDPEHGPDPGSAEARHARPGHRPGPGRQGGPGPGARRVGPPAAGRHAARGDLAGQGPRTPPRSARRSTPARWTATTASTRCTPLRRRAPASAHDEVPTTRPASRPRCSPRSR